MQGNALAMTEYHRSFHRRRGRPERKYIYTRKVPAAYISPSTYHKKHIYGCSCAAAGWMKSIICMSLGSGVYQLCTYSDTSEAKFYDGVPTLGSLSGSDDLCI